MRKAICLAGLLLLGGPAAAEPFHHAFGEWREYNQDWLAACPDSIDEDGVGYYFYSCFASTGSQEVNGANLPAYKLTLIRNRLDGVIDVAITVSPDSGEYDQDRPIIMQFGGEAATELAFGTALEIRDNTINQFFIIGPERAQIINRMRERNAVVLSVPLEGEEGMVESRLSLRGVLASLDFMAAYARRVAQY